MKNSCKGQSIVELALVLPIFLTALLAIVDLGWTFHNWISLNNQCVQAARAGARRIYTLVARDVYSSDTHAPLSLVEEVFWKNQSPMMMKSEFGNVTFRGIGTTASSVAVLAEYKIGFLTPMLNSFFGRPDDAGKITLHAVAEEMKE